VKANCASEDAWETELIREDSWHKTSLRIPLGFTHCDRDPNEDAKNSTHLPFSLRLPG